MSNNGVREKLGLREDPCGIFRVGISIHTYNGTYSSGRLLRAGAASEGGLQQRSSVGMGWAAGRRTGCSVLLACIAARCVALRWGRGGKGRADHRGPDCASNSSCRAQASGVLQHPLGFLNVGTTAGRLQGWVYARDSSASRVLP